MSSPSNGEPTPTSRPDDTINDPGSFRSKVVLTSVIGGILILSVLTLFLLVKISRGLRLRRERARRKGLLEVTGRRRKGHNAWDIQETEGIPA